MTISVLLDTSCLRKEGLDSIQMQELARLARARALRIVLPSFVIREYLSGVEDELAKCLRDASRTSERLASKFQPSSTLAQSIAKFGASCIAQESASKRLIREAFNQWIEQNLVAEIELEPSSFHGIIDDYFGGLGAFSSIKARQDFPDALIFWTVKSRLTELGAISVIVGDKNLAAALAQLEGVSVFETVQQLLLSKEFGMIRARLSEAHRFLSDGDFSAGAPLMLMASDWLKRATEEIESIYLEKEDLGGLSKLGLGGFVLAASVNYAQAASISDIGFTFASPSPEGNECTVGVTFSVDAQIHWATTYLDYLDLPYERNAGISSQDEDLVELVEWWRVTIGGALHIGGVDSLRSDEEVPSSDSRLSFSFVGERAVLLHPTAVPKSWSKRRMEKL